MEISSKSSSVSCRVATQKIKNFLKVVKPMVKFIKNKRRTNAVTPSSCNYDVEESVQNGMNESEFFRLHFKFVEDIADEAGENAKNEELEKRLLQHAGARAVVDARGAVRPAWAPDFDLCRRACATNLQTAEAQTPPFVV